MINDPKAEYPKRPKAPIGVLVVEDEGLLVMDLEFIIQDCGHRLIAAAASVTDVLKLDDSLKPHLALVDLHLRGGSSGLDVARIIAQRWAGALVIFVTANPRLIPSDYAGGHGVIEKPFSTTGMQAALHYIAESICAPPPVASKPTSLITRPNFSAAW